MALRCQVVVAGHEKCSAPANVFGVSQYKIQAFLKIFVTVVQKLKLISK